MPAAVPSLEDPARRALKQAAAALNAAEGHGRPFEMSQALLAVARACTALRAWAAAEAYGELALRWSRLTGSTDAVVEVLCELCEAASRWAGAQDLRRPGSGHPARERAREHVHEAATLAARVADPGWEVKVLLRISDVLDRCGDSDVAAQLQTRALRLMSGHLNPRAFDPALLPSLGRLADA